MQLLEKQHIPSRDAFGTMLPQYPSAMKNLTLTSRQHRHPAEKVRALVDLVIQELAHVALVAGPHRPNNFHTEPVNSDELCALQRRDPFGNCIREVLGRWRLERRFFVRNQAEGRQLTRHILVRLLTYLLTYLLTNGWMP